MNGGKKQRREIGKRKGRRSGMRKGMERESWKGKRKVGKGNLGKGKLGKEKVVKEKVARDRGRQGWDEGRGRQRGEGDGSFEARKKAPDT